MTNNLETETIAFIPARGGSKRLPRKNLVDFCGKPIIQYTIEAAQTCSTLDRIIVSTEDEEIRHLSERLGVEVVPRPPELTNDRATVAEVCRDYLDRQKLSLGILVVLYATAPLRKTEDINSTLALLANGTSANACTTYDLPFHQALRVNSVGFAHPVFPQDVKKRCDEMPATYVDNGSTYAIRIEAFLRERTFFTSAHRIHIMPKSRSVDIDTWEDLDLARFFQKNL